MISFQENHGLSRDVMIQLSASSPLVDWGSLLTVAGLALAVVCIAITIGCAGAALFLVVDKRWTPSKGGLKCARRLGHPSRRISNVPG